MKIGIKEVACFKEPYIIAEIGANHNGDLGTAKMLIEKAKEANCDCAKFQSWTRESIFSRQVYEENYFLKDDYRHRKDYTLEQIVEKYSFTEELLLEARDYCREIGIDFASTPFSPREVDFLVDEIKVDFIKVASMDLNNYPFLEYMAIKKIPIILSTGLSTLGEIDYAVETIEKHGNRQIILLHCVSNYPPLNQNINLNNIDMLRANYPDYPVGFSDHTLGITIPLAAVAKGACVIEKHVTLDKKMAGWDHKISADFDEMALLVREIKRVVNALGSFRRILNEEDREKIPAFRRSIVSAREIPQGKTIQYEDLDFKRPGTGIEPRYLQMIAGRAAKRKILKDRIITQEDF